MLEFHRAHWIEEGADVVDIPAGRAKVNFYIASQMLKSRPDSVMLPLGLPLEETIDE